MVVGVKLGTNTIEVSTPRQLFTPLTPSDFEVTPDGHRFLVAMPDPTPRPLNVVVNWPALMK